MAIVFVIDAMNVIGSVPDGWWRDRGGALARLVDTIDAYPWPDDEWVVVVADGRPVAGVRSGTLANVEVRYAGHSAPDAADDAIVALVTDSESGGEPEAGDIVVVTSDRGLRARLEIPGVVFEGARRFRRRLGA